MVFTKLFTRSLFWGFYANTQDAPKVLERVLEGPREVPQILKDIIEVSSLSGFYNYNSTHFEEHAEGFLRF